MVRLQIGQKKIKKHMNTKIKACSIFSLLSASPGYQPDSSQPIDEQGPL